MRRDHLCDLPSHAVPAGYQIRTFQPGDEAAWARIETEAGEFATEEAARRRFDAFFGRDVARLACNCFFLLAPDGGPIGTASTWPGRYRNEPRGQVSWVGIVPPFQSQGLAKPLLSAVMARLAEEHTAAFLGTQTTSYQAIGLYLAFGFVPDRSDAGDDAGWRIVEHVLHRQLI